VPRRAARLGQQPQQVQQVAGALLGRPPGDAGRHRGERDVVEGAHPVEQVEELEHHADRPAADPGPRVLAQRGQLLPGEHHGPLVRAVQPGGQVQQRGLAAPGRAGHRDELTGGHVEVHAAQGPHRSAVGVVRPAQSANAQHGL
jgi:hypothetical protein